MNCSLTGELQYFLGSNGISLILQKLVEIIRQLVIVGLFLCPRPDLLLLHVLDEHSPGAELLHLLPPSRIALLHVHNEIEDDHVISTRLLILMHPEDAKQAIIFPLNQYVVLWIQQEDCIRPATSAVPTFLNEDPRHRLL